MTALPEARIQRRILALAACALACSAEPEEEARLDLGACPRPQVVRPFQPTFEPDSFAFSAGTLYYFDRATDSNPASGLLAHSFVDGPTRMVTSAPGQGLWVEGDRVLFALFDELRSVPVTGGEPEIVVTGRSTDAERRSALFLGQQLDSTHLYWLRRELSPVSGWDLWRMPRAGGAPEKLAPSLAIDNTPRIIRMLPGAILFTGVLGPALVVSKATGAVRTIKEEGGPVHGFSDDGVLTQRATGAHRGGRMVTEFVLSPLDGSPPHRFWPRKPPTLEPGRGWPDGSGGWLFATTEEATDGQSHATIWRVDTAGVGKRLACDQGALSATDLNELRAVFPALDGIYAVMGAPLRGWSVVRIPHPYQ
jgi:hypothetical protein